MSNFEHYFALVEYSDHGTKGKLIDIARLIRPFLEMYLRYRFPGQFTQTEWLGDMIGRIRDSDESQPVWSLKPFLSELSGINEYSKHFSHGENPNADTYSILDPELKAYVERTLKVIGGVPILET